MPVDNIFPSPT